MAFQINPRIPLQAQAVNFDPASIIMQARENSQNYELKRLQLDRLREQFNQEKEARLRQKQMQQGIASELQKLQQGTPAQYRTTFPQTMPTGQMPKGMTGVLASERGQNLPTPDLFGENILKGNFDVRREMIAPEVKGVTPDYLDVLQIAAKHALQQNDIDSYVKFANGIKQERAAKDIEWGTNPTKGINPQTGLPDAYITNRKGDVKWLGSGVYEAPKDPKTSLITTSLGYEVVKEGELPKGAPVVAAKEPKAPPLKEITGRDGSVKILNMATGEIKPVLVDGKPFIAKDDPLTLFTQKEEFKSELKQREAVAQKYADASDVIPLLDGYIADLEKTPANLLASGYYKLRGLASTDNPELRAVTAANQKAKTLINYAQKQPGPSTDRDVMNYLEQVGVASDITQPRDARIAAAKSAKAYAVSIQKKYGKYASRILNGEITPDELKQPSKPTRSKDELFRLYKEFKADYEAEKDPAMRKIMIDAARADGLIK